MSSWVNKGKRKGWGVGAPALGLMDSLLFAM
jgi:hypothetical protein